MHAIGPTDNSTLPHPYTTTRRAHWRDAMCILFILLMDGIMGGSVEDPYTCVNRSAQPSCWQTNPVVAGILVLQYTGLVVRNLSTGSFTIGASQVFLCKRVTHIGFCMIRLSVTANPVPFERHVTSGTVECAWLKVNPRKWHSYDVPIPHNIIFRNAICLTAIQESGVVIRASLMAKASCILFTSSIFAPKIVICASCWRDSW